MGDVKTFPVFDCDAHINDPIEIWDYVAESERDLVRAMYWRDDRQAWLNGSHRVGGGGNGEYEPWGMYNPICIAGPQMNKKIIRRLLSMVPLDGDQRDYLEHKGARDPQARLREMDLMGIDQVLVIPTKVIAHLPFAENPHGVAAFCRAYNDFVRDWCDHAPGRLFPAALLPLQSPELAVTELRRVAERGFPVALMRPIDAVGGYPNDVVSPVAALGLGAQARVTHADLYRAFEETGVVLGMHTFPAERSEYVNGPGRLSSPGELLNHAGTDSQTLSFVFEMQDWLAQILLGGFLDRFPGLRMAVFESNSQWLPSMLESCDRYFRLYANERRAPAERLPSEAFHAQCVISFESDESPTMRQWDRFENIGIWASDCYHHDAADAWSGIREMQTCGIPHEVQVKLMGGNAAKFYGIEQKLYVTDEPPRIERPAWFPQGPAFEQWSELVAYPRRNAAALASFAETSARGGHRA